jgi:hypothetical protein
MSKLERIVGGQIIEGGMILDRKYRPSGFFIRGNRIFYDYDETGLWIDNDGRLRKAYGEEIGLRITRDRRIVEYGGWCFITSAVMQSGGKCDDCIELTILRQMRDSYMIENPQRRADVEFYYSIAPKIVKSVDSSGRSVEVWQEVYVKYILPAVNEVKLKNFEAAYKLYKEMVKSLSREWLKEY